MSSTNCVPKQPGRLAHSYEGRRTPFGAYHRLVSSTSADPVLPPADEALVRAHAEALTALAARHGITGLRYASPGRLVGHVADDKDLLDVATFDVDAGDLLGASVMLFSDAVLSNDRVSPDLVAAQPL